MARIVVHSMAHRGDVFPYVPIVCELSRRGHDVTYVVPREFHPLFEGLPFRSVHCGTDFSPVELDRHGAYIRRWGMKLGGGMLLRLYFGRFTIPNLDALFTAIDDELATADLLVSHPAASLVGSMSCERRGVPYMVGDLFPMLLTTATAPPAGMPNLGPTMNRWLWASGRSRVLSPITSRAGFVEFRTKLGLTTPSTWNVIDARLSPVCNVALVSPHYVQRAPDWPADYELTGFTSWSGPNDGILDDDVTTFLAAGPPPVIVTLGTSGASARPELFERVVAALDATGERGLLLTSSDEVTARVRAVVGEPHGVWRFAPLAPLLPHARAVVQSGAHGTNALTLAAGLPSAVVPCMFDQLWHARRQAELGTGVWVRRPRGLQSAVQRIITDGEMAERASALGTEIRREDGTGAACDRIETLLSRVA